MQHNQTEVKVLGDLSRHGVCLHGTQHSDDMEGALQVTSRRLCKISQTPKNDNQQLCGAGIHVAHQEAVALCVVAVMHRGSPARALWA